MALYECCGKFEGFCPCGHCKDFFADRCDGCHGTAPEGYAVDTDKLCLAAKQYCESGRDDVPWA